MKIFLDLCIFFLWELFWILFICENFFFLLKIFYIYLWGSHKNFFIFFSKIFMKANEWIPSFKTDLVSSKHANDILLNSYVPSLCFLAWILLILCLSIFFVEQSVFKFLKFSRNTYFFCCISFFTINIFNRMHLWL